MKIVYRYQVQDPCFYSPDSVYNNRCKESQLFSTLLRSLSETHLREEKTYVQQSWPIREKVKRENRCSTELTNQEKVKCGYVFENYLTQQKVIPIAEACNLQRDLYCHHASSLSYRAESSLSTYQSRRERSPLARSAAKSRGVRGQFWLSIWTLYYNVALSCLQPSRCLCMMYLMQHRLRCHQSRRCLRVYLS